MIHGRDAIRRTETSSLDCLHRISQDNLDLLERNSDDLKVLFFKAVCEDGDRETRDFLAESYRSYARYLEDVARPAGAGGDPPRHPRAGRRLADDEPGRRLQPVCRPGAVGDRFVFVEKLPLISAGKINKAALRRELAAG